ncbi:hypothetical protein DFH05DRAFT_442504 [Lentinula detonsa]|uniref:Uncharacterized protein n=1 Tax=Lentinula detonsa TaxID=2804962 RepID=A0A9W8NSL2_9AGAR|nr:hypothetical protein DFH05DRAFT_442504 [Lentinula detonsa]
MGSPFDFLPEELTEHILSLCVTAPFELSAPRPNWLAHSKSISSKRRDPATIRTRLAPLLVSKDFHRIAISHFYSTVHIGSPNQAAAFFHSLRARAHLIAHLVRRLVSAGIFPSLGAILQCCKNIIDIDFSLDSSPIPSGGVDFSLRQFCDALDDLERISRFTLRRAPNAYLTLPRTQYVLTRLAGTIENWRCLESANVAFRMSDDNPQALLALAYPLVSQSLLPVATRPLFVSSPVFTASPPASPSAAGPPSPAHGGPVSLLTSALAKSPSLHTFTTHVPSVWNETILCVSQNPSLQKIVLGDPRTGVLITGLFMAEAKNHPRLVELIKAGTSMVRTRAHTLGNLGNGTPSSTSSTPKYQPNVNSGCTGSDRVPTPSRSKSVNSMS